MILFSKKKKRIVFKSVQLEIIMSTKKSEKPEKAEDKKDQSALNEIKKIETSMKSLSANINKLKSMFKAKGDTKKEKA